MLPASNSGGSKRTLVTLLLIGILNTSLFTSPLQGTSPSKPFLVEAFASDMKKSALFLQELRDQTSHPHSSLLYNNPALNQDHRDLDGQYSYERQNSNHGDHFDEPEYPGYAHDDQGGDHHDFANSFVPDGTVLQKSNNTDIPATFGYNENNAPFDQRLRLTRDFIERTCHQDRGSQRNEQLNNTFLVYCSRYKLENLLSNDIFNSIMHKSSGDCKRILDEFIQLDETINQFDNLFITLLSRYNCHNGYSVKWNCDDCKKAYKDWLCATHLPLYMGGERIKPCISFCERVEQRCPYLHPITREQYGGQPVFICRDPNIPFVPEITPDIPYNDPGKCYDLCHLSNNSTELENDSLSKYDHKNCPKQSSIAAEVRAKQNGSKLFGSTISDQDALDYAELNSSEGEEDISISLMTNHTAHHDPREREVHVHNKKLQELREVLAVYKNQAQTHRYHAALNTRDHKMTNATEDHYTVYRKHQHES